MPPPQWHPLTPLRLAYETALTDVFCALPDVDERAAVRRLLEYDPPPLVWTRFIGDPIARRLIAYTFGSQRTDPARYAHLRVFVELLRDARYLIGLGHALVPEGVPFAWTQRLLRKLQAVWFAQDAQLRGDRRDLATLAAEIERDEIPVRAATPDGARTVQRIRTPFGATFTSVALDRPDGSTAEDFTWDFPADVAPAPWQPVIEQATVRHMQLWGRFRRVQDAYVARHGALTRTLTVRHAGILLARRTLRPMPNYEPLVAHNSTATL